MKKFIVRFAIAVAIGAALAFILLDPDCADTTKEPVGAQHPVECK